MSQRSKVLYRLPDTVLVVNADVAYPWNIGPHVDKYQRHLTETKIREKRFLHTKCQDSDTVNAALDHPPDGQFGPLWVMHGGGQKDFVVVLNSKVLKVCTISGKKGFVISETMSPKMRLFPETRARAWVLG